jgi:hypothetical protein
MAIDRREEGDDRQGRLLVRGRRERRARGSGWAGLLGHACCWARRARARARGQAARLGRARGGKEESARDKFLFFSFKNVNSINICLFH